MLLDEILMMVYIVPRLTKSSAHNRNKGGFLCFSMGEIFREHMFLQDDLL